VVSVRFYNNKAISHPVSYERPQRRYLVTANRYFLCMKCYRRSVFHGVILKIGRIRQASGAAGRSCVQQGKAPPEKLELFFPMQPGPRACEHCQVSISELDLLLFSLPSLRFDTFLRHQQIHTEPKRPLKLPQMHIHNTYDQISLLILKNQMRVPSYQGQLRNFDCEARCDAERRRGEP